MLMLEKRDHLVFCRLKQCDDAKININTSQIIANNLSCLEIVTMWSIL